MTDRANMSRKQLLTLVDAYKAENDAIRAANNGALSEIANLQHRIEELQEQTFPEPVLPELEHAQLLRVQDGDYLVLRAHCQLTQVGVARLKELMEERIEPLKTRGINVEILVIDGDLDLAVLRPQSTPVGGTKSL